MTRAAAFRDERPVCAAVATKTAPLTRRPVVPRAKLRLRSVVSVYDMSGPFREGRPEPASCCLHAPEILDCVDHHAGSDRDQENVARDAHILMTRTWWRQLNNDCRRQLIIDYIAGKALADVPFLRLTRREAAVILLRKARRAFAAPEFRLVVTRG